MTFAPLIILSGRRSGGTFLYSKALRTGSFFGVYDVFNETLGTAGAEAANSSDNNLGHPGDIKYFESIFGCESATRIALNLDFRAVNIFGKKLLGRQRDNAILYLHALAACAKERRQRLLIKVESYQAYLLIMSVFPKAFTIGLIRELKEVEDSYRHQAEAFDNYFFYEKAYQELQLIAPHDSLTKFSDFEIVPELTVREHLKAMEKQISSRADVIYKYSISQAKFEKVERRGSFLSRWRERKLLGGQKLISS